MAQHHARTTGAEKNDTRSQHVADVGALRPADAPYRKMTCGSLTFLLLAKRTRMHCCRLGNLNVRVPTPPPLPTQTFAFVWNGRIAQKGSDDSMRADISTPPMISDFTHSKTRDFST